MPTIAARIALFTILGMLVAAVPARAQTEPEAAPPPAESSPAATVAMTGATAPALSGPTVWGLLDWFGVGIGARYMFPLSIPSLLSKTPFRDSWALEAGLDFLHRSDDLGGIGYSYDELIPTVGMSWIVWLKPNFAVYPKVEAGYAIGFHNSNSTCGACSLGGIYVEGAAGLLFSLGGGLTLRAELGNYGVKGGVGWLF